jgi:tRNA pseudouridine32 synthase/23S rRNA pseudouridine746 synthase
VEAAPEDPDVPGPLRVLYDDAFVTVVDKPAGLPSVPGRFRKERDSVLGRLGGAAQVLHELDAEARGLVVVAKSGHAAVALHRQFGRGELVVTYAAWLDGAVAEERGVVSLPLRLDREDRPRRVVDAVRGKRAVTEWRVVERANGTTLVELTPKTDRTHQLRVHAAHPAGLGAAIVGDELYGREPGGDIRLALRAQAVRFVHPQRGNVQVALTDG